MILTIAYEVKLTFFFALALLLLFVGFIIFIVILYNKNQINHIKESQIKEIEHQNLLLQKEIEKQKSLQTERERISHDMHDEIGAGLSAIKLQSEILKQNIDNQNISKTEIDELIHISEEINLAMREILWSLNSSNDNMRHMIDYCRHYMENYFSKTTILFSQEVTIQNPNNDINSEIRRNILLAMKEACHNIIKHSKATTVHFSATEENNLLIINIKDNGVGLQNIRTEGYGLTTMKSRTESVGGIFKIIPEESGTRISISIPLKSDRF